MVTIKTPEQIEALRVGGKRLALILQTLAKKAIPGVSAFELDQMALDLILANGDKPAFLNYKPYGAKRPYPATLCVSINDEVVHGLPGQMGEKILKEGDIVSLDSGIIHKGLITDSAITVPVGKVDKASQKLLEVTEKALYKGISVAKAGNTVGDIGFAIESYVTPFAYGIVRELSGHGVGLAVHEDPYVPNYGHKGEGLELKPGMVLAIEPMLNEGHQAIKLDQDGFTYRTKDGKRSAHFEHTVVITKNGAEILTEV